MKKIIFVILSAIIFNLFSLSYAGNEYRLINFSTNITNIESFEDYAILEEKILDNIFLKKRLVVNQQEKIESIESQLEELSLLYLTVCFLVPSDSIDIVEKEENLTPLSTFSLFTNIHQIDKVPIA